MMINLLNVADTAQLSSAFAAVEQPCFIVLLRQQAASLHVCLEHVFEGATASRKDKHLHLKHNHAFVSALLSADATQTDLLLWLI